VTFERSHGKARPGLPRAGKLKAVNTAPDPSRQRTASGHFAVGNELARDRGAKQALKRALGVSDQTALTELTRSAQKFFGSTLRTLPSNTAPVRALVALHARHLALCSYYSAKAEEVGLDTDKGLALSAVAARESQRAERTLVTAIDVARVCAEEDARKPNPLLERQADAILEARLAARRAPEEEPEGEDSASDDTSRKTFSVDSDDSPEDAPEKTEDQDPRQGPIETQKPFLGQPEQTAGHARPPSLPSNSMQEGKASYAAFAASTTHGAKR
jgi:hypothetical protein